MKHLAAVQTEISTAEFAKLFRHEVFRLHRLSLSARDPRSTSAFMSEVCHLLYIKQGMSTA